MSKSYGEGTRFVAVVQARRGHAVHVGRGPGVHVRPDGLDCRGVCAISLRMSVRALRVRCGVMVLGLLVSCGEAAAPAPVPEEFDDPFADEAAAAAKAVPEDRSAAEVDPAATGSVPRLGGASGGAGVASAGAAGAAVNGSAGGGGDAPAPVASPGAGPERAASAVAGAEAPAKRARRSRRRRAERARTCPGGQPTRGAGTVLISATPAPTPAPRAGAACAPGLGAGAALLLGSFNRGLATRSGKTGRCD